MGTKLKARMLILLVVTGVTAAMAGCGSSSDESASAAEPLSKAEFIRQIDAACQKAEETKAQSLEEVFSSDVQGGRSSKHRMEQVIAGEVIPLFQNLIAEMGKLKPPLKDEAQIEELVASYRAAWEKAKADPEPLINSDPFLKANEAAHEYGIESCVL